MRSHRPTRRSDPDRRGLLATASRLVGLLALSAVPSFAGAQQREAADRPIALRHVTLIDGTGSAPRRGVTVLVAGGQIRSIGPSDRDRPPDDARIVDATGKYLIPGLWDMHAHCAYEAALPLFLANGVTGVRIMWGNPSAMELRRGFPILTIDHFRLRDRIRADPRSGPRLMIAGRLVDGPRPIFRPPSGIDARPNPFLIPLRPLVIAARDAEDGREAVRQTQRLGADFVKVYSLLPAEAYRAVAEEAGKLGLPFAGHLPIGVGAWEAARLHQRSMEHLFGIKVACSAHEDRLMAERIAAIEVDDPSERVAQVVDRQAQEVDRSYDPAKAARLFDRLRRDGVWQCPTLATERAIARRRDPTRKDDPRRRYIPPLVKMLWDRVETGGEVEFFARLYRDGGGATALIGPMRRAGVGFLAGTDEGTVGVYPGFSLHDELELLVSAGLSPMEALQAATRNAALCLGLEKTGTITEGNDADLVLLDADPLERIGNTRRIAAVIRGGYLLPRAELDKMLDHAAVAAPGPRPR